MPVLRFKDAAAQLGYRGAAPLHRMRRDGQLGPFLRSIDGTHALEMEGLAAHLAGILRNDRRRPAAIQGQAAADEGATGATLLASKARREHALAGLAELQLAQKEQALVPIAEVRQLVFAHIRAARDQLLTLPARIAPAVMGASDLFTAEKAIEAAVRDVVMALARDPFPAVIAGSADLGQPITETNARPDDATARRGMAPER